MTPETYFFFVAPWLVLAAIYCWDYAMDLLVPVKEG